MKRTAVVLALIFVISHALVACGSVGQTESSADEPDITLDPITTVVTETETEPATETETEKETKTETEYVTEPVTETETEREAVRVTGLTLDKYEVSVKVGASDMPWVTMTPAEADDLSEVWSSDNTAVATVDAYGNIYGVAAGDCTVTVSSHDNPSVTANVAVHVEADAAPPAPVKGDGPAHVGLTYIQGILIVNKTYALPSDYDPGIDPVAYAALEEMFAGAYAEGITLWIASGYRSYATQDWLYNNYVAMDGKEAADTYSARPGHSEHQTGLAFDLNYVADFFATTPEGIWLANNSWKYGFIIRYQKNKEAVTGYKYEPWHVRYVGKDAAKAIYDSGLCLEEYLGVNSVYSY